MLKINLPFLRRAAPKAKPLPTGTVTFLFTDIEGSTRMWETQPLAMRAALARHDALLRQSIAQHNGHIFKTGGDAFYAVFGAAPDGLAAALTAQLALRAEPWPEAARLRVRMALHSGPAELRDGDYYGPPLNRVARLIAAAHGGQTLLSDSARTVCNGALPASVVLKPLGEHALKDLPEPEPIFQLCCPDLPEAFPALRTHVVVDTIPSIAVLPFVNMSRDEQHEYFADGLSEELLNVLAKIRGLRVASRTSAFSFKGKDVDISTVAHNLNVANVLEGSVRTAGKRVRITAQLIEAATDSHLWSDTYDRELDDIFAVQDDIAQSVVKELLHRLMGKQPEAATNAKVQAEVKAAAVGRTESAEAYTFYLQGQFFRSQLTRDNMARAIGCFEQALKIDPEYALAWAGLSRACLDQAGQSWVPAAEGYAKARAAVVRAVELGPNLPEAHIAMGWVRRSCDWDWKGADASFSRALELAPGSTLAMNGAAILIGNLGRFDEACGLLRRAVGLDPLNVAVNRNLGLYCLAGGALEEAETALNKTLQLSPQGGLTQVWLALVRLAQGGLDDSLAAAQREVSDIFRRVGLAVVHYARGERAESDAALAELIEHHGTDSPFQVAGVYGYRGETDQAFEWLERTYAQHDPGLAYMKMDPLLQGLHSDPRWQALLVKMRLAD